MRIDPTTLLFEGIDPDTRVEMFQMMEALVLQGTLPHPQPQWMSDWFEAGGFDDRQRLMVMSTVLPVRVFLSLLREPVQGEG